MSKEYALRQTKPDQIMTHWDTCWTLHSACMERKVEQDAQQIAALTEQLRIATEALEHILGRGYTGAAFVAEEALRKLPEVKHG